eukprot:gene7947-3079_t
MGEVRRHLCGKATLDARCGGRCVLLHKLFPRYFLHKQDLHKLFPWYDAPGEGAGVVVGRRTAMTRGRDAPEGSPVPVRGRRLPQEPFSPDVMFASSTGRSALVAYDGSPGGLSAIPAKLQRKVARNGAPPLDARLARRFSTLPAFMGEVRRHLCGKATLDARCGGRC